VMMTEAEDSFGGPLRVRARGFTMIHSSQSSRGRDCLPPLGSSVDTIAILKSRSFRAIVDDEDIRRALISMMDRKQVI
jgi:hypothetical protein